MSRGLLRVAAIPANEDVLDAALRLVVALEEELRWPAFVPRARQRGINSILSTPASRTSDRLVSAYAMLRRSSRRSDTRCGARPPPSWPQRKRPPGCRLLMMPNEPSDMLETARQDAMLSLSALWVRYFELGGMGTALELEAYLCGALQPSPQEYDVLAHTLNERFFELGGEYPIPYSDDEHS